MGVYPSSNAPIPIGDLETMNTDRSVFPPIMMRGFLVKNQSGEWVSQGPIAGAGLNVPVHDYIGVTYPDTSTEVYTYKTGGSSGTTVATVTVVYTDAVSKSILESVTRT